MVELTTENGGNSDVTARSITVVNEEEKARIKLSQGRQHGQWKN